MRIYKVVVDKKPNHCTMCPLIRLRLCGKDRVVKPSSSGTYVERVPDSRCLLREEPPTLPVYAKGGIVKHNGLAIIGSDYSNEKLK